MMRRLWTGPTEALDAAELRAVRTLLEAAFEGSFGAEDWTHALGGVHALIREEGAVLAHGSVVPRQLELDGRRLRAGYVEAVAVRGDARRRGLGAAVMAALEGVVRAEYALGALSSSAEALPFYAARGWLRWGGETRVRLPDGVLLRTPEDDDAVHLLPTPTCPSPGTRGSLVCEWRPGDVW